MTPEELELRKLEIDAEIKRSEIRAGIYKIALGTSVVGLGAAFFPFAQQYATEYFAVQIETMKQTAAIEIQAKESEIKNTTLHRGFLASVGQEGRSKKLKDRIILAEYYFYLSDQDTDRKRWKKFLDHLYKLRKEDREATIESARIATTKGSSPSEIAVAKTKARLLRESSLVSERSESATEEVEIPEIRSLIDSLSSNDTAKRRGARSTLGKLGIEIVRPIMVELSIEDLDYRTRLGLLVSLTEMMRDNKEHREHVASLLQPNDLDVLLTYATDSDRTIRIYAAEFLFDLGDPRLFDLAILHWNAIDSDNGRYNLALVMKGLAPFANREHANEMAKKLDSLKGSVGPKTDSLLDDAIKILR